MIIENNEYNDIISPYKSYDEKPKLNPYDTNLSKNNTRSIIENTYNGRRKDNKKTTFNRNELNTHTIIDYSINNTIMKTDKFITPKPKFTKFPFESTIKINEGENNTNLRNSSKKREKFDIHDKKIKTILEKSKENGKFLSPYFSLCNNCNKRNNEFYNEVNSKIAYDILNTLDGSKRRRPKFG